MQRKSRPPSRNLNQNLLIIKIINDSSLQNWDNTSKNRNDGTNQWGGSKEEQFQKDKWDYGDGSNQSTNEGKHNLKTEIFGEVIL